MKNIKSILIIAILALGSKVCVAQQDPMVSEYMFNQLFLNPAYAGTREVPNMTLLYRNQWVNFAGAPTTELLSADGAIKGKNMGIGLTVLNDHIGVSNRLSFYGDYSYHLKLNDKQSLAMGINAGGSFYKAQLTDLLVWDQGDNVFTSNIQSKFIPGVGAGLYWHSKDFFAGLSVPNLLSYKPNTFLYLDLNAPQFQRHYFLDGGFNYAASPQIVLMPSVLLKYTQNAPFEADFNLNVMMDSVITIGASYRTGDSFLGLVQFYVVSNLKIGYAYDYPFTELRQYSAGTHEIMISYDFGGPTKHCSTQRAMF